MESVTRANRALTAIATIFQTVVTSPAECRMRTTMEYLTVVSLQVDRSARGGATLTVSVRLQLILATAPRSRVVTDTRLRFKPMERFARGGTTRAVSAPFQRISVSAPRSHAAVTTRSRFKPLERSVHGGTTRAVSAPFQRISVSAPR